MKTSRLLIVIMLGFAFSQDVEGSLRPRIPANATTTALGWTCNDGYLKRDEACVTVADARDAEIKEHLVASSIAGYSGSCACPFNADRAGRRCGARSAYSRPGGASPLCYPADVSEAEVRRFRATYPKRRTSF